jgi:uncharacterized membrane protein YphA (DoxX/SURF4 family)
MINFSALLADAPLPDPTALRSPSGLQNDPTIDHGGQFAIYVGLLLMVACIAAIVGFFSRRVEHALITALVLSLCVIVSFAFIR